MPSPKEIHDREQIGAGFRTMASGIASYYMALLEETNDPVAALSLTIAYQNSLVRGRLPEDPEEFDE